MQCKTAICNLFYKPELYKNADRWMTKKHVNYCFACYRKLSWKEKFGNKSLIAKRHSNQQDIREGEEDKDEVLSVVSETCFQARLKKQVLIK